MLKKLKFGLIMIFISSITILFFINKSSNAKIRELYAAKDKLREIIARQESTIEILYMIRDADNQALEQFSKTSEEIRKKANARKEAIHKAEEKEDYAKPSELILPDMLLPFTDRLRD